MRISCTTLESFRLWSQPDQEWMTEDSLIETIKGVFTPTPAILLGQAFGKVLETPERYQVKGGYRYGDFCFDDATMAEPLKLMDRRGVFEAKATKTLRRLHRRRDGGSSRRRAPDRAQDHLQTFDFDKYAASCQWRFMADIFEPALVTYHVFLLDDHGNGIAELRGIETFNLYPYADLHEDCAALVRRFREYAIARGLDGLLRQRQEAAA
jgi:hypothetical protein